MHSSRMRTACSLPYGGSVRGGGVLYPRGLCQWDPLPLLPYENITLDQTSFAGGNDDNENGSILPAFKKERKNIHLLTVRGFISGSYLRFRAIRLSFGIFLTIDTFIFNLILFEVVVVFIVGTSFTVL